MTDRQPPPLPLSYARTPRRPKPNRWCSWVRAHVAASYLSVAAFVSVHLLFGSGHFSIAGGAAGHALLAFVACPFWVPVVLVVAPVMAAMDGVLPYPAFFAMAATYAASLVLVRRPPRRRDTLRVDEPLGRPR